MAYTLVDMKSPSAAPDPTDLAGLRAADLATLLGTVIMDADDAAAFLAIERGSLEYAAYRNRIMYVSYGAKKLFCRADLIDYRSKAGRGRESKLESVKPIVVK